MIPVVLPGLVMLASGAACLGGAIVAKSRVGVASAAIMLLAMLDLITAQFVPAPVWALLLMTAAIALGVRLRVAASDSAGEAAAGLAVAERSIPAPVSARSGMRLGPAVMVASAVSYVAMAWLVMTHAHGAEDAARVSGEDRLAHAGHSGALMAIPAIAIAVLIAVQLTLFFASLRGGRRVLALETGAMAAMLLAMFVMPY